MSAQLSPFPIPSIHNHKMFILSQSQRPYEFLTNCSGLLERSFAMVRWLGTSRACRDTCFSAGRVCGCHDHDSRCLHNNWIPKLLVSVVCAGGVDTRPAGQVGEEEG